MGDWAWGMARKPRLESGDSLYHVINRGNYRSFVFESEGARQSFERVLYEACQRAGWQLLTYCAFVGGSKGSIRKSKVPNAGVSITPSMSPVGWAPVGLAARLQDGHWRAVKDSGCPTLGKNPSHSPVRPRYPRPSSGRLRYCGNCLEFSPQARKTRLAGGVEWQQSGK